MEEIEVKILGIDPSIVEGKLLSLGAKKIFDEVFEEWLFSRPKWKRFRGRVRVRKSKNKIEVAYKETTKSTAQGNLEIEFEVSKLEVALEFVKKMGVPLLRHQQKRRVHFTFEDIAIDIDYWPMLPPFLEIEADNIDKVERFIHKLGITGKRVEMDAVQIYQEEYGISLSGIKELVF